MQLAAGESRVAKDDAGGGGGLVLSKGIETHDSESGRSMPGAAKR